VPRRPAPSARGGARRPRAVRRRRWPSPGRAGLPSAHRVRCLPARPTTAPTAPPTIVRRPKRPAATLHSHEDRTASREGRWPVPTKPNRWPPSMPSPRTHGDAESLDPATNAPTMPLALTLPRALPRTNCSAIGPRSAWAIWPTWPKAAAPYHRDATGWPPEVQDGADEPASSRRASRIAHIGLSRRRGSPVTRWWRSLMARARTRAKTSCQARSRTSCPDSRS
jgi:hypothetical protein